MFLKKVIERNPQLIDAAVSFHQQGVILPDTYILDLDMIEENARQMVSTAEENGIELFFMTKQFGRNPYVSKALVKNGIKHAVVVDFREALVMMENDIPLGNVGHLVQIPKHLLKKVMHYGTKYITVYSLDKLKQIDTVASELGITQNVLLRVVSNDDELYEGQYGGFKLEELEALIPHFRELKHVQIKGITSFPCFLYSGDDLDLKETHNVQTINRAKKLLTENGFDLTELNVPSATCSYTIPFIKKIGGTQGEPGHALTGTTPLHAVENLVEKPAMVYVSEVSHQFNGQSYIFGGGYYRRGHLDQVLLTDGTNRSMAKSGSFSNESIDYYLELEKQWPIGLTAIMSFRTQVFVTRSEVAVVKGIQSGKPEIVGIYDSQGKLLRR
ncbi:YhfX family PLP-dependent enzyme [Bacillus sp. GB_SG_008]|uniref:YhfX family PLP-dependent enzyme n=1 Tax=Bacillus sp. GB_SG_008 TaxID=3454627 RepID=UPI003F84A347